MTLSEPLQNISKDEALAFIQKKNLILKLLVKKEKSLLNAILKTENRLQECLSWESVFHQAELLKANFHLLKQGQSQISVEDWMTGQLLILKIDPSQHCQDIIKAWYKKAKKLKRGIDPQRVYLERLKDQLNQIRNQIEQLNTITCLEELNHLDSRMTQSNKIASESKPKTKVCYLEFRSASGLPILVGRNAKDNDILTFTVAHGNDWWMHVRGAPGSHVVIRTKGKEPDEEAIQDAIQLALDRSKLKNVREGEVCITQKKFVSQSKRAKPGQVQVSKHSLIWATKDEARLQLVKKRQF